MFTKRIIKSNPSSKIAQSLINQIKLLSDLESFIAPQDAYYFADALLISGRHLEFAIQIHQLIQTWVPQC